MRENETNLQYAKKQFEMVFETVQIPIIYKMAIFLILSGALVPRFQEFKYYYMVDELGFSDFEYGIVLVGACAEFIIAVLVFRYLFTFQFSHRWLMGVAMGMTSFFSLMDVLFYLRVY